LPRSQIPTGSPFPQPISPVRFILDESDAMLECIGSDRTQIVAITMYSTVIEHLPVALARSTRRGSANTDRP
jgi:hypothetical protein